MCSISAKSRTLRWAPPQLTMCQIALHRPFGPRKGKTKEGLVPIQVALKEPSRMRHDDAVHPSRLEDAPDLPQVPKALIRVEVLQDMLRIAMVHTAVREGQRPPQVELEVDVVLEQAVDTYPVRVGRFSASEKQVELRASLRGAPPLAAALEAGRRRAPTACAVPAHCSRSSIAECPGRRRRVSQFLSLPFNCLSRLIICFVASPRASCGYALRSQPLGQCLVQPRSANSMSNRFSHVWSDLARFLPASAIAFRSDSCSR